METNTFDNEATELMTRDKMWERKLLDISLRNNLINLRIGRRALPFVSFEIEKFEDYLQDGRDYQILPNPDDKHLEPGEDGVFDSNQYKEQYEQLVLAKAKEGGLVSYLNTTEFISQLKYLYRESRNSLEENGANSLFLTLGLLKWFETEKSEKPRYAPILLLPVDIIRRSNTHYIIRTREEDITFNTALVEMLNQDFHLTLGGIDPLPSDDHGCDVRKVLAIMGDAVRQMPRWEVLEESMLGLFSFSKFVMWNDIHSNIDLMNQHPVIKALLDKSSWQSNDTPVSVDDYDATSSPKDNAIPVDVDSSQLEAVLESGEGHSFILYGPPGTGKSQTITNMIANALFHGKRVLFVAEKKAALEVVQHRLEKIGLAPFCLELHSNKVTKSHFLKQLDEALSLTRINNPDDYERVADELLKERKVLRQFNDLMHDAKEFGLSLYDCIMRYSTISVDAIQPTDAFMKDFNANKLEDAKMNINELGRLISIIGRPADHPLHGLNFKRMNSGDVDELKHHLSLFAKHADGVSKAIANVNQALALSLDNNMKSLPFVAKLHQLLTTCDEKILFENTDQLKAQWDEISGKWFLPRYFGQRKFLKYLRQYAANVQKKDVEPLLADLEAFHREADNLGVSLFNGSYLPFDKQRVMEIGCVAAVREIRGVYDQMGDICSFEMDNLGEASSLVDRWLGGLNSSRDWLLWCNKLRELRTKSMEPVIAYAYKASTFLPTDVYDAYAKGCCQFIAQHIIDGHQQLQLFKGALFEEQIAKYKELDNKFKNLTKQMLYYRLASRVPSQTTGISDVSELGLLKRYIRSKGRGVSIRKIMDHIPELLPRLCPVMLMSPISVAQFIGLRQPKFDIVCFDEASQMPTSEAVGAISRGKALICVGDPKQMPPTSFFAASATDEDDVENADMESILDDCITLSMPERYLNWHYRSRHESLIAFSNMEYYDGRLFTFPSTDDRTRKVKFVKVEGTYDYGRTRCNEAEADAIVDEVVRRLATSSQESIGVVAFSKVQQNLIEDKLGDRLAENHELEAKAFGSEEPIFVKNLENVQGDERDVILFSVGYGPSKDGKLSMNFGPLNNVGGERRLNVAVSRARNEMMVFTIMEPETIDLKRTKALGVAGLKGFLTFAKTGQMPMGKAQQESHTKNIADVIASELKRRGYQADAHVGRSAFKIDVAVIDPKNPDNYILGILCDGSNFYQTKTERERVISQPSFLHYLGWNIMRVWTLDWYMDKQQVVDRIVKALKDIKKGKRPKEEPNVKGKVVDPIQKARPKSQIVVSDFDDGAKTYMPFDYQFSSHEKINTQMLFSNAKQLRLNRVFYETIRQEQPITFAYLCKRVAGFYHINVVTKKFVDNASVLLGRLLGGMFVYRDATFSADNPTYWVSEDAANSYHDFRENGGRKINEIPEKEISNAILYVIDQQVALPENALVNSTSLLLGYCHSGAFIDRTIRGVVDKMIADRKLVLNENGNVTG